MRRQIGKDYKNNVHKNNICIAEYIWIKYTSK